jgi:hypothetical protein
MGNYFSFPSEPLYSCLTHKARGGREVRTFVPTGAGAVPFGLMIKDLRP